MASHFVYDKARAAFMNGGINMTSDTIKVALVVIGGGHYVADSANDQFLSAIASGDRAALSLALTTKTTTAGVFDADDVVFSAPAAGDVVGALVLYKDTGSPATSPLIAYTDLTGDYSGLGFTTNGLDVNLAWPDDANKIFKL